VKNDEIAVGGECSIHRKYRKKKNVSRKERW